MQKRPASESGVFHPRVFPAFLSKESGSLIRLSAVRKRAGLLVAVVMVGCVICPPAALAADASAPLSQAEAESFVTAFYKDLEGGDVDTIMARFDRTVEYYKSGPKDRSFIANALERLFGFYPSRSYSIGAVKLKPLEKPERATVSFDLRSFLRNPEQDVSVSGHAQVEWDLVKSVGGSIKITRYDGTALTTPTASPAR